MANGNIIEGDDWPPALGKITTWAGFGLQLRFHGGKGGRKKANACEGEVTQDWRIVVTKNPSS